MIRRETVEVNGRKLIHTWSDKGKRICRGSLVFDDAYDVNDYTYTETDEDVKAEDADDIALIRSQVESLQAGQKEHDKAIEASAEAIEELIAAVMGGK